jgi:pyruvate/2-oxoglutarate dehydrogenase complex dihydrolipoamide acyltransferase (E2) component
VSSSSTDALIDVTMPQMGVSVAEGTVVEWRKQPGDWVQADEVIAAISTDKIDTDVESPATGRVQEILVPVGETVEVGTVLARITTDAHPGEAHATEAGADEAGPQGAATVPQVARADAGDGATEGDVTEADVALSAPGDAPDLQGDTTARHGASAQRGEAPAGTPARRPGSRRYSPVVARMAAEHHLDLERIAGTGRGGRVRKQDVLAYLARAGDGAPAAEEPPMHIESPYRPDEPAPPRRREPRLRPPEPESAPAAGGVATQLSRMRRSIGAAMVESLRTAATCTTVVEADMTRAEALRRRLGTTFLPVVARATVETLREFPDLNATLEDDTVTRYDAVHLGIAVSLGDRGLIVPVVRDAHELSVEGLAARIKELARRARDNELTADEVRGGTFTITNPGGYGSIIATPVINQPQVAILDTEAVVKRPVVVTDELGQDSIAIRHMTYLCMSWDHRALDGALAAQFLRALADRLEAL